MAAKQARTLAVIFLALVPLLPLAAMGQGASGQGLTDFWTLDIHGNEITQEIFAPYQLTLVNVWATYCQPCLREMPALAELDDAYEEKGVNVIGIVTDVYHSDQQIFANNLETAYRIIAQTGADYLHLLPSEDLVEARLQYVQAVPETFFVDSKGNVVGETYIGARSKSAWESIIKNLLTTSM